MAAPEFGPQAPIARWPCRVTARKELELTERELGDMADQTQRAVQRGLMRIQKANLLAHFLYDHLAGKVRNPLHALALAVIALFSFYISIVKEYRFSRRFGGMATVSLGVAGLSFVVGVAVKLVLGVDV